jgi:molybdopterin converting factor subunit 1
MNRTTNDIITCNVKFFAMGRELVGASDLVCSISAGTTIAQFRQQLRADYPALERLPSFAVAINAEYADDDQILCQSDEVAIIPPVSGG